MGRFVRNFYEMSLNAMPTVHDKFFRSWEEREPFWISESIGACYAWIDEQTTIK